MIRKIKQLKYDEITTEHKHLPVNCDQVLFSIICARDFCNKTKNKFHPATERD